MVKNLILLKVFGCMHHFYQKIHRGHHWAHLGPPNDFGQKIKDLPFSNLKSLSSYLIFKHKNLDIFWNVCMYSSHTQTRGRKIHLKHFRSAHCKWLFLKYYYHICMKTWSDSFILILGERKSEVILSRKYQILPDSGCTQEIVPFNMHLRRSKGYL